MWNMSQIGANMSKSICWGRIAFSSNLVATRTVRKRLRVIEALKIGLTCFSDNIWSRFGALKRITPASTGSPTTAFTSIILIIMEVSQFNDILFLLTTWPCSSCMRYLVILWAHKYRLCHWNDVPSCSASLHMSTSSLAAAILNLLLPVWYYNIVLGPIVTSVPKNIGFSVQTAFLAVFNWNLYSLWPPYWIPGVRLTHKYRSISQPRRIHGTILVYSKWFINGDHKIFRRRLIYNIRVDAYNLIFRL